MAEATHYDVIIIGTGAGGGTLADTLAVSGKRILLLERGDERLTYTGDVVVVACGAINSAALLLRSVSDRHPGGLANRSGVDSSFFVSATAVNPSLTIIANALRVGRLSATHV